MEELTISCDECCFEGTTACEDCIVTFLFADESSPETGDWPLTRPKQAVIVDAAEIRAMRLLHSAGLAPKMRFERRVG